MIAPPTASPTKGNTLESSPSRTALFEEKSAAKQDILLISAHKNVSKYPYKN